MSVTKLVFEIGEHLNQRQFIGKIGAGAMRAVAGVMGFPIVAHAHNWECCDLCLPPPGFCNGCACTWCWACCNTSNGSVWKCCECHSSTSDCGDDCNNVISSCAFEVGPPGTC
jgi:hypothetical protein